MEENISYLFVFQNNPHSIKREMEIIKKIDGTFKVVYNGAFFTTFTIKYLPLYKNKNNDCIKCKHYTMCQKLIIKKYTVDFTWLSAIEKAAITSLIKFLNESFDCEKTKKIKEEEYSFLLKTFFLQVINQLTGEIIFELK